MERIGEYRGLQLSVVSDCGDVDYGALANLLDAAWRRNYRANVRTVYDEAYLRWLLGGTDWVGVVCTHQDQPVGCMFSLLRTLLWRGNTFRAAYSSLWAVHPKHRRPATAIRLARAHREVVYDELRCDVGVGLFHDRHAGERAVSAFAVDPQMPARFFHRGAVWSRRLIGPPSSDAPGTRSSVAATGVSGSRLYDGTPDSHAALLQLIERSPLTFEPTGSFARLYLRDSTGRSGTIWGERREVAACFAIVSVAMDEVTLGRVGQIHCLYPTQLEAAATVAALNSACAELRKRGCFAASIVDQGYISAETFKRAGFSRSEDTLVFCATARPRGFPQLEDVRAPCVFDWI